jgi:hypothetical protein
VIRRIERFRRAAADVRPEHCSGGEPPAPNAGVDTAESSHDILHCINLVRQPAVTIGRMFSDTFAGIAPNSARDDDRGA